MVGEEDKMTRLTEKQMIDKIKKRKKKLTSSRKKARNFLVKFGTHNPDGTLTEEYSAK